MERSKAEMIRENAYHIWEREGHPHGRELDHWLQAETNLSSVRKRATAKKTTSNTAKPTTAAKTQTKSKTKAVKKTVKRVRKKK